MRGQGWLVAVALFTGTLSLSTWGLLRLHRIGVGVTNRPRLETAAIGAALVGGWAASLGMIVVSILIGAR